MTLFYVNQVKNKAKYGSSCIIWRAQCNTEAISHLLHYELWLLIELLYDRFGLLNHVFYTSEAVPRQLDWNKRSQWSETFSTAANLSFTQKIQKASGNTQKFVKSWGIHKKPKHHNSHATPWHRQPDSDKLLWTLRCGWNHADYQESLRAMNSWFLVMLVEKGLLRIGNMWKWYLPPNQNITIEPFGSEASKYAVDYRTSVYHNE